MPDPVHQVQVLEGEVERLQRENTRLREALAFAASALESGELHAAPLIREALAGGAEADRGE